MTTRTIIALMMILAVGISTSSAYAHDGSHTVRIDGLTTQVTNHYGSQEIFLIVSGHVEPYPQEYEHFFFVYSDCGTLDEYGECKYSQIAGCDINPPIYNEFGTPLTFSEFKCGVYDELPEAFHTLTFGIGGDGSNHIFNPPELTYNHLVSPSTCGPTTILNELTNECEVNPQLVFDWQTAINEKNELIDQLYVQISSLETVIQELSEFVDYLIQNFAPYSLEECQKFVSDYEAKLSDGKNIPKKLQEYNDTCIELYSITP